MKEAVTVFIDELHSHPNCSDFLHEFLNMVQNNMLIVESTDREDCATIWTYLNDMHQKCLNSEDYTTLGTIWDVRGDAALRSVDSDESSSVNRVIKDNPPVRLTQYQPRRVRRRRQTRIERYENSK